MKILVVRPGPHFSVADVCRGWVDALRNLGCTVVDFNFDDRLNFYATAHNPQSGELVRTFSPTEAAMLAAKGVEAACYELQPDVVMIISGFFIPPAVYELIRVRGSKVVLVHTESPYEDDRQVARAQLADLNILNDPTNIDRFPQGTVYLPHAYDPKVHHPRASHPEMVSDLAFCGTGYPSRIEFLEQCDFTGMDVALAGNWVKLTEDSPLRPLLSHPIEQCCPNEVAVDLYASTKASLNLYRKEHSDTADGWSMGPREVELAACGTFFLREPRCESDEILSMLPTFSSPGDFTEKLRWWLAHPAQRIEAAMAAREAVADRTFEANATRLLSLLAA